MALCNKAQKEKEHLLQHNIHNLAVHTRGLKVLCQLLLTALSPHQPSIMYPQRFLLKKLYCFIEQILHCPLLLHHYVPSFKIHTVAYIVQICFAKAFYFFTICDLIQHMCLQA